MLSAVVHICVSVQMRYTPVYPGWSRPVTPPTSSLKYGSCCGGPPRPPRLHHNGPRQLSYKNENNACLYLQFHTGAAAATANSSTRVLQFYHYHVY